MNPEYWIQFDFSAERLHFSFLSRPPSKTPSFPLKTAVMCLFNNLAMIRRTSAHLSDRAKAPVDFWFRPIDDDDHAQLEQGL